MAIVTICALATGALLVYPLTVIQPFKHQAPDDLQRSLWVFRFAPWPAMAMAIVSIGVVVFGWQPLDRWSRRVAGTLVVVTCMAAAATRLNVFELMFHPAGAPQFLAIPQAKLDAADMLVTVALNGEARAYPIREMGYHHVVNDAVGGVPIVATY